MTDNVLTNLSVAQLKQAVAIRAKIETLESELSRILGAPPEPQTAERPRRKRTMSAAAKAKIAAAQRARWADKKEVPALSPRAAKGTRHMSPEARARIAAAARARWARIRASKEG